MRVKLKFSLRSAIVLLTICACVLGGLSVARQKKQLERQAIKHILSRSHAATATGPDCAWPLSAVLGADYHQHVRSVQMWNFKADSAAVVADLPYLERVHICEDELFKSGELTVESFASLRGQRHIIDLYIDAPFDDRILAHFTASRPKRLVLWKTQVTGKGLADVSPGRLEVLTLYCSPIDDQGFHHVTRFGRLRHLFLFRTRVSDEGLSCLAKLPTLETLIVIDSPITDDAFSNLPPTLRRVFLADITITDEAIEQLAKLELEELHLVKTAVTPSGIRQLHELSPTTHYRLEPEQGVRPTAPVLIYDAVFFSHPDMDKPKTEFDVTAPGRASSYSPGTYDNCGIE